jgi:hypothetical protein
MKVMVFVKASPNSEAGVMPEESLMRDMMAFNQELMNAGMLLGGDGLTPSSRGARVRFNDKERLVINGPFAETNELVAGYWLWEVKDMDDAIAWVKRCPCPMPGEVSEIEIRPLYQIEDFGDAVTPDLRATYDAMQKG